MKVMQKMESLSADFGTLFSMEDTEVVISGRKPGIPESRRGLDIEPHRGLPALVDAPLPLPYIVKRLKAKGYIN